MANGDFLALMDQDDLIPPNALLLVAEKNKQPPNRRHHLLRRRQKSTQTILEKHPQENQAGTEMRSLNTTAFLTLVYLKPNLFEILVDLRLDTKDPKTTT